MEKPPFIFQAVTHFSIVRVEKRSPRSDNITKLTVEIESRIPLGRYPLVLRRPFPSLGRPGKEMDRLASLRAEDIESIWVFPERDDSQWARIEIQGKPTRPNVVIRCDLIDGVPGWDKNQIASNSANDSGRRLS